MEIVSRSRSLVGESPFWSAADQRLYWADLRGPLLRLLDPADSSEAEESFAEPVAAPLPLPSGRVALLLARGLYVRGDEGWSKAGAPGDLPETHRFNDATIDPEGRLIAGTMLERPHQEGPSGRVYRFDSRGWTCLIDGFRTINGLAFSPAGDRLYLSDSHPSVSKVWQASYDVRTGTIGPLHPFALLPPENGRPDGAAIDEEGGYWIAGVGGGRLIRFDAGGRRVAEVETPVRYPTKLAFGGEGLRTTYVTSMIAADPLDRTSADGALFAFDAGVVGCPIPPLRLP